MLDIKKIYEGIRREGLNSGIPMTFVELGLGREYPEPEALVGELIKNSRFQWICFLGQDTTQVGMGTIVRGLHQCSQNVEIEIEAGRKDPGWIHSASRWVVDYSVDAIFNYQILRANDMIRIPVEDIGDLEIVNTALTELKKQISTKYIKIARNVDKELYQELVVKILDITTRKERVRIY